ncbi:hypothetical protein UFOVP694_52 [uncultured Caudovirales phage]|uniref:Uncharacterized protein n=1 Tax=uncultured Caudovirales phage TaxID=2100421 RepID=A0A6J5NLM3_9CAUD|nr:hypothetical protein UFOVP694_52 [uncultured Caudovirales phage]
MAQYRGYAQSFTVGYEPPTVTWTVVKGDTASFRVYVTDNNREPIDVEAWEIEMDIVPPNTSTPVVQLSPGPTVDDGPGEFTVSLTSQQSDLLTTGDRFDIQLSTTSPATVWTVAQGTMVMIETVTE